MFDIQVKLFEIENCCILFRTVYSRAVKWKRISKAAGAERKAASEAIRMEGEKTDI